VQKHEGNKSHPQKNRDNPNYTPEEISQHVNGAPLPRSPVHNQGGNYLCGGRINPQNLIAEIS
jgi:hypothetical protein